MAKICLKCGEIFENNTLSCPNCGRVLTGIGNGEDEILLPEELSYQENLDPKQRKRLAKARRVFLHNPDVYGKKRDKTNEQPAGEVAGEEPKHSREEKDEQDSFDDSHETAEDFYREFWQEEKDKEKKDRKTAIFFLMASAVLLVVLLYFGIGAFLRNTRKNNKNDNQSGYASEDTDVYASVTQEPTVVPEITATVTKPGYVPGKPSAMDIKEGTEGDAWEGTVKNSFDSGEGTEASPYIIKSGDELAYLANEVNMGNSFEGICFALGGDINLGGRSWTPIGYYYLSNGSNLAHAFSGSFDGKGYTISNLMIDGTSYTTGLIYSSPDACVGLFGALSGAEIKNLNIKNAEFSISRSGGEIHAGLIAGYANDGVKISACNADGNLNIQTSDRIAAGLLFGVIKNSEATGCSTSGSISLTNKTAAIDAALGAGYSVSSIFENNTIGGSVTSECSDNSYIGGLIGYGSKNSLKENVLDLSLSVTGKKEGTLTVAGGISGADYEGSDSGSSVKAKLNVESTGYIYAGGECGFSQDYLVENISAECTMVIKDTSELDAIMAGGLFGHAENIEMNSISVSGSLDSSVEGRNYVGGCFGNVKDSKIFMLSSNVSLTAESVNESTSDIRAGGLAGNTSGTVYDSAEVDGSIKIVSALDGYAGGAFGCVENGEYYNVNARGELSNTSKNVASCGGIAGYAKGDYVIDASVGSGSISVTGEKKYEGNIIGIKG